MSIDLDAAATATPQAAEQMRVVVAGVCGGVGTTTVAALLAASLGTPVSAPQLLDHSGGGLAARLDPAVLDRSVDERLAVHDLGATLYSAGVNALLTRDTVVVLVAAATAEGLRAATLALEHVRAVGGPLAPARPLLVAVRLSGARRSVLTGSALQGVAAESALTLAGVLPYDRSLLSAQTASARTLSGGAKNAIAAITTAVRAQLPAPTPSGLRGRAR
jgi:MinD-like ATPase involved in chromosome partitioning or flagellar assembly